MDKSKLKTVERIIRDKSEAQLKGLIIELCGKFSDAYEHILLWGKDTGGADINDKLALEYWRKAEKIIDEFNQYGGGSEYEEEEVYGFIESISELIPSLSWATRKKIIDGMLVQYHYGNSGFDDSLTDACFELCKERDEWLYLVEKLNANDRRWNKKLVMDIYKIIGDDEAFLKMRTKNLEYGTDYFELVQHYDVKGDIDTALSWAHKGLEKGEGRIKDIITYLFDHYEDKNETAKLEELFTTCEKRQQERSTVAGKLFIYYKDKDNYENAKRCLLKEFEYTRNGKLNEFYKRIMEYLTDDDWQQIESELFTTLKKRDMEGYLHICLEKGLKQEVYDIITSKGSTWGSDYDYFANKLKKDFPEKIIEYYYKLALHHVEVGSNRKNYKQSMKYFKKTKDIYIKVLKDKPRWDRKLVEFRLRYKTRRAFLEESRVLD
jgi:hypothetical protein